MGRVAAAFWAAVQILRSMAQEERSVVVGRRPRALARIAGPLCIRSNRRSFGLSGSDRLSRAEAMMTEGGVAVRAPDLSLGAPFRAENGETSAFSSGPAQSRSCVDETLKVRGRICRAVDKAREHERFLPLRALIHQGRTDYHMAPDSMNAVGKGASALVLNTEAEERGLSACHRGVEGERQVNRKTRGTGIEIGLNNDASTSSVVRRC